MEIPDDCYESYTNDEEDESYQGQGISEPLTPEETDDSCASPGSDQSVESVQPSTFSMMDKTRFMLSVFMFAFMFCGPLKYLIGPQKSGKYFRHISLEKFSVSVFSSGMFPIMKKSVAFPFQAPLKWPRLLRFD